MTTFPLRVLLAGNDHGDDRVEQLVLSIQLRFVNVSQESPFNGNYRDIVVHLRGHEIFRELLNGTSCLIWLILVYIH